MQARRNSILCLSLLLLAAGSAGCTAIDTARVSEETAAFVSDFLRQTLAALVL